VRVLIVDDDVPTRVGLRAILSSAPDIEVVGEASTGEEALPSARRLLPDVVLMDIRLPGVDGIAATRDIVTSAPLPPPKVIVLTTFDFDEYAYQAMGAGASAFLLKRTPAEQLIASVRAIAGGEQIPPGAEARRALEPVRRGGHDSIVFAQPLTSRERDVLYLVVEGLTNAEIAKQLIVSVDTVKTHLKHIYSKSGVQDRAHLVIAATKSGFGRGRM
jgi:DNA-binding NarL/FixJ family response regulator